MAHRVEAPHVSTSQADGSSTMDKTVWSCVTCDDSDNMDRFQQQ